MSLRPGALARSDARTSWQADGCGFGPHARHILSWRFGHEKKIYDQSLLSADSRRVVVSYWRKNVHLVLVSCLGGLPRNSVDRLTDRARNDLSRRAVKQ